MHNLSYNLLPSADGNAFCYHLREAQVLNTTGFKVMRNFSSGLIPVYLSCLNGCPRLVYDVAGFVSLSALGPSLTPQRFARIADSLLKLFERIRSNGFIRMECLFLDVDHIMVDSEQGVHLIYLPVDDHVNETARLDSPEGELRQSLISFIDSNPNVRSERVLHLHSVLKNSQMLLSEALAALHDEKFHPTGTTPRNCCVLKLVSLDGSHVIPIDAHGAIIGRDITRANALLTDGSVSGVHCRVYLEKQWFLEDLGSRNGTRLNGQLLTPHQPAPLAIGDEVCISTLHFLVKE